MWARRVGACLLAYVTEPADLGLLARLKSGGCSYGSKGPWLYASRSCDELIKDSPCGKSRKGANILHVAAGGAELGPGLGGVDACQIAAG
jgi:hypothetical protein